MGCGILGDRYDSHTVSCGVTRGDWCIHGDLGSICQG